MDIFTINKSINIVDLIKNIPCGFCIYSTKLQHIEFNIWNKYMIEITGYTMNEINKIGWTVYFATLIQSAILSAVLVYIKIKNMKSYQKMVLERQSV